MKGSRVRISVTFWCLTLLSALISGAFGATLGEKTRCEEITIPMCRGIGYNLTHFPNEFNHETQEEAGLEVHQFWPLVEINCSSDLRFFLCSLYAPICIEEYMKPLPPCKSVCERARDGCAPLMQKYGFAWPERMACDKMPAYGDHQNLCMEENNRTEDPTSVTMRPNKPHHRTTPKPGILRCRGKNANSKFCREEKCRCRCQHGLINLTNTHWDNRGISVAGQENCALPCQGVFFTADEREFASIWITLWSILCCVSTLMTVTTFLIDTDRFKYPERPIVFLSACYFMVSIGYLVRVVMGHEAVACENNMIRYNATGPAACTMVFLLIYFYGMASSIWWVILSLTWFLAAGLKWGNEAIASYSQYFHLAAWLIPTIKSIAVLIMTSVDGDPVAGICYVGNQNMDNMRGFVLIPLVIYLLLGTSFLLGGFVSLFRIRNVIKQQGRSKADKLEKLMIRIGIFSVLYTVPATIVIGCYFYESIFYEEWMQSQVCPCETPTRPIYSIIMLKYFMALAVGITSGVWIWSGKTLDSWRRFTRRITGSGHRYQNHTCGAVGGASIQRTVKQINYNPSAVGVAASVQSSHVGSVQKQAPLSHV